MKKTTLFFSLILTMTTLFSCGKDYSCECKTYENTTQEVLEESVYTVNGSKAEAVNSCNANEAQDALVTIECEIK